MKKFVSIFSILFTFITLGLAASDDYSYPSFPDEEQFERNCFGDYPRDWQDIRAKSLTIMNMIDKSKSKSKIQILITLLEVELDILEKEIKKRIELSKESIAYIRQAILKTDNPNEIKNFLKNLENNEKHLEILEGGLYFCKQWKRDYCH